MSGKKIQRTKCLNSKKVRRPIFNGKKSPISLYPRLDKSKIKEKLAWQRKVGSEEESPDMDGDKPKNQALKQALKTTKHKPSKRDLKPSLFKKQAKEAKEKSLEAVLENLVAVNLEAWALASPNLVEHPKEKVTKKDDIFLF